MFVGVIYTASSYIVISGHIIHIIIIMIPSLQLLLLLLLMQEPINFISNQRPIFIFNADTIFITVITFLFLVPSRDQYYYTSDLLKFCSVERSQVCRIYLRLLLTFLTKIKIRNLKKNGSPISTSTTCSVSLLHNICEVIGIRGPLNA